MYVSIKESMHSVHLRVAAGEKDQKARLPHSLQLPHRQRAFADSETFTFTVKRLIEADTEHPQCQMAHLVPALKTHLETNLNTVLYFITFVTTLFMQ